MNKELIEKIQKWQKGLHKHEFFEEGMIKELENHLLDEIESLQEQGYTDDQAFDLARKKLGKISSVEKEERKANIAGNSLVLPSLLRSFLKAGSRYLGKNRLTTAINMGGLVVAFTAILFIGLFLHDELSFERHHPDFDKVYRLSYEFQKEDGSIEQRAFSSGMWADLLTERNPSIDEAFRFVNISYGYIHNPESDEMFYEEGVYWSDPNFFDFLNFSLKYGRPEDQLQDLNSIILTERTATKIFGDTNPVGKLLNYRRQENVVNMVVSGVIYDPPSNSHFQPDYIAHIQSVQHIFGEHNRGWVDKNPRPGYMFSYLKINDAENLQAVKDDLKALWVQMIPGIAEQMEPLLTPISAIHFNPPMRWEIDTPVDMSYMYGLMIIAVFILIIALTNFANLTTAQGSKRQKEIGLRKTLGSTKNQLKVQFFIESGSFVLTALVLSILAAFILMESFNQLIDKNIDLWKALGSLQFSSIAVPAILLILIFSGLLPAIYFTRRMGEASNLNLFFLKEKVNSPARNALVILQFTVAITLVISTITIYNQLDLINGGFLGKSRDTVIGIRTSRMGDSTQAQGYKSRIASIVGVEGTTLGMHLPRQSDFGRIDTKYFSGDQTFYWNKFDADGGFINTYDLELIAGDDFKRNIQFNELIVNEAAIRQLGVSAGDALGTYLKEDSINYVYQGSDGVIIGVVKDFVYESIREEVEPLVICANNYVEGVLSVKLSGDKLATIENLKKTWLEVYPDRPFEYWFLDKEFDRLYSQERRLGKLVPLFSGLAIVISLLGLFALTVFISELRKKEIGIRKVLGCSTSGVVKLLGWQFVKTLIPAILIGIPVAYFGLSYWLNNFSYRVNVSPGVILISVGAIVFISVLTISVKSIASALSNPVDSLKYE